jgi:hypothetical protein
MVDSKIITPDFGRSATEDHVKGNIDEQLEELQDQAKEIVYKCNACGHEVDKSEGENVLMINLNVPVLICPNCRTLQLPEQVFNDLLEQASSRIIKPI